MSAPKPAVVDQATLDWEGWGDHALAATGAIRWKILIGGERTESRGLVTGVAQLAPGAQLLPHHHEPEETYYHDPATPRLRLPRSRRRVNACGLTS